MSSSSVCQGLKSCVIEPRVLTLKLTPPNTEDETNVYTHGGFSSLNSLSQSQHTDNTPYVHPLPTKRRLSDRSLEMCTESLGSETGSFETTNDVIITTSSSSPEKTAPQRRKQMNRNLSYPPPLTSSVQVRPRREGGRLLLEAVTVNASHTYFHAERSHGRLRLSIIKHTCRDHDELEVEEQEEETEDTEGINEKESSFMKKVSMPSRCKEGANNNQIVKWASPWVVTSS